MSAVKECLRRLMGNMLTFQGNLGVQMSLDNYYALKTKLKFRKWDPSKKLHQLMEEYGQFISRHLWHFLLIPPLISVLFGIGIIYFRVDNDMSSLYTPTDAPSRREIEIHDSFQCSSKGFNTSSTKNGFTGVKIDANTGEFAFVLLFESQSSSLDFLENPEVVLEFDQFLKHNFHYDYQGKSYNFGDTLCVPHSICQSSADSFKIFAEIYLTGQLLVDFTYPILEVFGEKYYLGNLLHGVSLYPGTNLMASVSVVQMYVAINKTHDPTTIAHWNAFKQSLNTFLERRNRRDETMHILMFSPEMLNEEVKKIQNYTLPYITLTFAIIFSFAVLSNLDSSRGWSGTYSWEAVGGVLASLLSLPSTFGILFLSGATFNGSITMTPFLILAIGIDDTFIMLGAWHKRYRTKESGDRLGGVLREVGVAIFLTSTTSVASFAIGALWTKTPAMVSFCQFTAVGIAVDFLLQITFFPALLILGGRREADGRHGLLPCIQMQQTNEKGMLERVEWGEEEGGGRCTGWGQRGCEAVIVLLNSKTGKVGMLVAYVVYLSCALYGCSRAKVDLKTERLLVDDSSLKGYLRILDTIIWAESVRVNVYVTKPPDFRIPEMEEKFLNFTKALESTPYSVGEAGTTFWLKDYKEFREAVNYPTERYYYGLYKFVERSDQRSQYLHWKYDPTLFGNRSVEKFKFDVHFFNLTRWSERIQLLKIVRREARKMKEYGVSVHMLNSFSSDQVGTLGGSLMQTVGVALLAMGVLAMVFFPSLEGVFWVFLSLLSIDVGVVGFLILWGADIDPITMTDIVLSIGFSIDFSAHYCFQFYRSELYEGGGEGAVGGVEVLRAVGWPILQCGLSTILAILPLALVPAYIVRVFFKTVFLAVGLGLIHALVLLPAVLPSVRLKHSSQRHRLNWNRSFDEENNAISEKMSLSTQVQD